MMLNKYQCLATKTAVSFCFFIVLQLFMECELAKKREKGSGAVASVKHPAILRAGEATQAGVRHGREDQRWSDRNPG